MRKGFIIIIAIIACSVPVSFGAKVQGYFITNAGDTVRTVFRVPVNLLSNVLTYEKMQWKVKYGDKNTQAHTLMPDQAREFCFTYRGTPVRFLSVKNSIKASSSGFNPAPRIFLQLILDGTLNMFNFYEYDGFAGSNSTSPDVVMRESPGWRVVKILQKNSGELFRPRIAFFRKDMCNYLSDCPGLAGKITDRTYKSEDMKRIVEEYNEMCTP